MLVLKTLILMTCRKLKMMMKLDEKNYLWLGIEVNVHRQRLNLIVGLVVAMIKMTKLDSKNYLW